MSRKMFIVILMLLAVLLMAGCDNKHGTPAVTPYANMPNPASVFCEQNGGKLQIRTDASGGQQGFCVFPDGSQCDEWAYYRGECKPGDSLVTPQQDTPIANMPNPAAVFCEQKGGKLETRTDATGGQQGFCIFPDGSECDEWAYFRGECMPGGIITTPTPEIASDGWKVYRDVNLGFTFHYPADAAISHADDPDNTLTILGPLTSNGENWPMIYFNHPQGRPEYAPPQGVDLEQWLKDNNLVGEKRMADLQIAGTTAIHYRHDRSPQSYADDRYFFAHDGQLYSVVILHTGDKEDWDLYNHFLESIQFE